jgi:hypothetical protein
MNLTSDSIGQLHHAMVQAIRVVVSAFVVHVVGVVLSISRKKMVGIYARWVVAFMQDVRPPPHGIRRRYSTYKNPVRHSVC